MQTVVIINPAAGWSGAERSGRQVDLAWQVLRRYDPTAEVLVTEGRGDGTRMAREMAAQGCSKIIAWGGDGTVNEVVPIVVEQGITLGIVPAGTGNGLAKELKLDRRPERALVTALKGRPRRIDVGELGGRMFVNVAGIGFDAHVGRLFNARKQRRPIGYITTTISELFKYTPVEYSIVLGNETHRRRALIVALANSRQYGSGAFIAPQAQLDDGKLQLVVVDAEPTTLRSLWKARHLYLRSMNRARGVLTQGVESVTILSESDICFHVDGEVMTGPSQLTAKVHPGALRVCV